MRKGNRFPEGLPTIESQSFSNFYNHTAAGEIEFEYTCQKVGKLNHKNENISKTVNPIDSGASILARSAQDLSRNAPVVFGCAL